MLWAIKNGCPWTIDSFASLTQRGNVAIIEEILQDKQHHGLLFVKTEGVVKMTPEVVEAINKNIFGKVKMHPMLVECFHRAFFLAFFGRANEDYIIEKLKLLRRYGYEWNAETIFQARQEGQYRVVQWLEYMGCPTDEDIWMEI